ncbi:MAG: thiol peroxidase [Candidatus Omnitrophota bacterium]
METKGLITFKGGPLTLIGSQMTVGQQAPDFKVLADDLSSKSLADFKGKVKLVASVPSLDTPVCDLEIKRFNDAASDLSKDGVILFISCDLPFAQKRFCDTFKIAGVRTFSDHRDVSFGTHYGVLIKELRLLTRAVFIIDAQDKIRYLEVVKEVTSQPDYQAALTALKQISG